MKYEGPFLLCYPDHPHYGHIMEVWHPMLHYPIEKYFEEGVKTVVKDKEGKILTLDDIK